MARKSGGGISISTIVFLIIAYNVFFSDDDADKKEVKVIKTSDKQQISETLKESANNLKEEAKVFINEAKKEFEKAKEEFLKPEEKENQIENESNDKEEIVKKKEEKIEELKPIEDKKPEKGMKKL